MAQPEAQYIQRVEPMARSPAETRYCEQVGRVFNRISLTGLPERDPRLHELPLDRVFVPLSVEVQRELLSLEYDVIANDGRVFTGIEISSRFPSL